MNKVMKAMAAMMLLTVMCFVAGCNKPENKDDDVRVTTYTPQDVTQTSAVCGGDVIVTQGLSLSELGVCWSTSSNPTAEDSHLSTSNWSEPYVCSITGLDPGTKYHVRAYALRGLEYYYGDDKSFTTEGNSGGGGGNGGSGNGTYNGHAYVDLGLPSGTLWATCNVGATTPEGYGDHFAWGETQPKGYYDWSTYMYYNGDTQSSFNRPGLTKYCTESHLGYCDFADNLTTLLPEDDAATANWGGGWRMPTKAEFEELYYNTTFAHTQQNGVNGILLTADNGNSLFLPTAASYDGSTLYVLDRTGCYLSSSLNRTDPLRMWALYFSVIGSADCGVSGDGHLRYNGSSVRAVCR